jgi:hypothetical protein
MTDINNAIHNETLLDKSTSKLHQNSMSNKILEMKTVYSLTGKSMNNVMT